MATSTIKSNVHKYGSLTEITSYTATNKYTIPANGLLRCYVNYRTGAYLSFNVSNGDGSNEVSFQTYATGISNSIIAVPVFAGQKAWVASNNVGGSGGANHLEFIRFE